MTDTPKPDSRIPSIIDSIENVCDADGNSVPLGTMCIRDPAWAADRIRSYQADLAQVRLERDGLSELVEELEAERAAMRRWTLGREAPG